MSKIYSFNKLNNILEDTSSNYSSDDILTILNEYKDDYINILLSSRYNSNSNNNKDNVSKYKELKIAEEIKIKIEVWSKKLGLGLYETYNYLYRYLNSIDILDSTLPNDENFYKFYYDDRSCLLYSIGTLFRIALDNEHIYSDIIVTYLYPLVSDIYEGFIKNLNYLLNIESNINTDREIILLLDDIFIMLYDSLPCDLKMFKSLLPLLERCIELSNERITYMVTLIFMVSLNISVKLENHYLAALNDLDLSKLPKLCSLAFSCFLSNKSPDNAAKLLLSSLQPVIEFENEIIYYGKDLKFKSIPYSNALLFWISMLRNIKFNSFFTYRVDPNYMACCAVAKEFFESMQSSFPVESLFAPLFLSSMVILFETIYVFPEFCQSVLVDMHNNKPMKLVQYCSNIMPSELHFLKIMAALCANEECANGVLSMLKLSRLYHVSLNSNEYKDLAFSINNSDVLVPEIHIDSRLYSNGKTFNSGLLLGIEWSPIQNVFIRFMSTILNLSVDTIHYQNISWAELKITSSLFEALSNYLDLNYFCKYFAAENMTAYRFDSFSYSISTLLSKLALFLPKDVFISQSCTIILKNLKGNIDIDMFKYINHADISLGSYRGTISLLDLLQSTYEELPSEFTMFIVSNLFPNYLNWPYVNRNDCYLLGYSIFSALTKISPSYPLICEAVKPLLISNFEQTNYFKMESGEYSLYLEACILCLISYFKTLFSGSNDIPLNVTSLFPHVLSKLIGVSSPSSLKLIEILLPHLSPFVIPPSLVSSPGGRSILIQLFKRDWFVLDRASTKEGGDSDNSKTKEGGILGKILEEIDPKNSSRTKENVNEALYGLFSYLYRTKDYSTLDRIRKPVYDYLTTITPISNVNMNLIGILSEKSNISSLLNTNYFNFNSEICQNLNNYAWAMHFFAVDICFYYKKKKVISIELKDLILEFVEKKKIDIGLKYNFDIPRLLDEKLRSLNLNLDTFQHAKTLTSNNSDSKNELYYLIDVAHLAKYLEATNLGSELIYDLVAMALASNNMWKIHDSYIFYLNSMRKLIHVCFIHNPSSAASCLGDGSIIAMGDNLDGKATRHQFLFEISKLLQNNEFSDISSLLSASELLSIMHIILQRMTNLEDHGFFFVDFVLQLLFDLKIIIKTFIKRFPASIDQKLATDNLFAPSRSKVQLNSNDALFQTLPATILQKLTCISSILIKWVICFGKLNSSVTLKFDSYSGIINLPIFGAKFTNSNSNYPMEPKSNSFHFFVSSMMNFNSDSSSYIVNVHPIISAIILEILRSIGNLASDLFLSPFIFSLYTLAWKLVVTKSKIVESESMELVLKDNYNCDPVKLEEGEPFVYSRQFLDRNSNNSVSIVKEKVSDADEILSIFHVNQCVLECVHLMNSLSDISLKELLPIKDVIKSNFYLCGHRVLTILRALRSLMLAPEGKCNRVTVLDMLSRSGLVSFINKNVMFRCLLTGNQKLNAYLVDCDNFLHNPWHRAWCTALDIMNCYLRDCNSVSSTALEVFDFVAAYKTYLSHTINNFIKINKDRSSSHLTTSNLDEVERLSTIIYNLFAENSLWLANQVDFLCEIKLSILHGIPNIVHLLSFPETLAKAAKPMSKSERKQTSILLDLLSQNPKQLLNSKSFNIDKVASTPIRTTSATQTVEKNNQLLTESERRKWWSLGSLASGLAPASVDPSVLISSHNDSLLKKPVQQKQASPLFFLSTPVKPIARTSTVESLNSTPGQGSLSPTLVSRNAPLERSISEKLPMLDDSNYSLNVDAPKSPIILFSQRVEFQMCLIMYPLLSILWRLNEYRLNNESCVLFGPDLKQLESFFPSNPFNQTFATSLPSNSKQPFISTSMISRMPLFGSMEVETVTKVDNIVTVPFWKQNKLPPLSVILQFSLYLLSSMMYFPEIPQNRLEDIVNDVSLSLSDMFKMLITLSEESLLLLQVHLNFYMHYPHARSILKLQINELLHLLNNWQKWLNQNKVRNITTLTTLRSTCLSLKAIANEIDREE